MTPTAEQPSSLPGLSDTRLEEIAGQINRAHDMVSALCHGTREWVLSIPAEPERDLDLVIGDGLQAGRDLFREVRRLQGELAAAREATAQLREELKIATTPDIYGIEDTIVDADDLYSLDLGVGDVAQVWANRVLGNRWVACSALPDSDDYECAVFDTEAEARAAVRSRSLPGETADA